MMTTCLIFLLSYNCAFVDNAFRALLIMRQNFKDMHKIPLFFKDTGQ